MLRDDRQLALDNVIVALENASDAYADASEILKTDDPPMAARFDEMARRRAALAERLAEHLRAMGDLPSEPDQDLETLDVVVRHLRAQFAGPEWDEFLSEAISRETEISGKVDEALAAAPPEPVAVTLTEAAREIQEARDALETLRNAR